MVLTVWFRSVLVVAIVIAAVQGFLVTSASAQSDKPNPVVATINDQQIRLADVEAAHRMLPQQYQGLPLQAVYGMLLDTLVDQRLLADAARKKGLDSDPEFLAERATLEEKLLQRAFLNDVLETRLTDAVITAEYETRIKTAPPEQELHARHILVDSQDVAQEIITALDGGEDFATLAKTKSTGPSGTNGGDLGFFSKTDMVPEFAEAAFALKPGSYTPQPVKTQFGWHVILAEEFRDKPVPPLEEVKQEIFDKLAGDLLRDVILEIRAAATIERFNLDGTPQPPQGDAEKPH